MVNLHPNRIAFHPLFLIVHRVKGKIAPLRPIHFDKVRITHRTRERRHHLFSFGKHLHHLCPFRLFVRRRRNNGAFLRLSKSIVQRGRIIRRRLRKILRSHLITLFHQSQLTFLLILFFIIFLRQFILQFSHLWAEFFALLLTRVSGIEIIEQAVVLRIALHRPLNLTSRARSFHSFRFFSRILRCKLIGNFRHLRLCLLFFSRFVALFISLQFVAGQFFHTRLRNTVIESLLRCRFLLARRGKDKPHRERKEQS